MKLTKTGDTITVWTFYYAIHLDPERFKLIHPRINAHMVDCPSPVIYRPEFHGQSIDWQFDRFETEDAEAGPVRVKIICKSSNPPADQLTITLTCYEEHYEIAGQCSVKQDAVLSRWHLFQPGTHMDLYNAHHFRSRHGRASAYDTYNIVTGPRVPSTPEPHPPSVPDEIAEMWNRPTSFSTYSYDWQFAPHPSFILFERDEAMFCIGARDLPNAYGLDTQIGQYHLHHMYLDYGGKTGYPIHAGEQVVCSRMYMWVDYYGDIWSSVRHYIDLLIEDEMIPRRSLRDVPHWWLRPIYCTWQDQGYLASHTYSHLHKTDGWTGKKKAATEGEKKTAGDRYRILDHQMVEQVLDIIRREKLPFGSIILDCKWFPARGQWEPDPEQFPDMRSTVDMIHDAGLKAILWMSVFMVDEDAAITKNTKHLINGGQPIDRYPKPCIDFSHPDVQQSYVIPTMQRLFSTEPGCCNADGIKLDYFAGKIYPEHLIHDRTWRGEERFTYNTIKLIYDQMKSHKPDACMIGISIHPWFIACQDLIRTYDVTGTQYQHLERGKMIRNFCPGNILSMDFVEEKYNWEKYFQITESSNARFQFSNIIGINGVPLDQMDFHYLRNVFNKWQ